MMKFNFAFSFRDKKSDAILRMALILLVTCIIFVIMLCIVYFSSANLIIQKQTKLSQNLLDMRTKDVDSILEKADAILYNYSTEFLKYGEGKNLSVEEKLELLNKQGLVFSNEFDYFSFYVYFKESDVIVDLGNAVGSLDTFYDTGWVSAYENAGFLGYKTLYIYNRDKKGEEVLSILRDFPLQHQEKAGTFIINISREDLFDGFNYLLQTGENTLIYDDDGALIYGDLNIFNQYSELLLEEEKTSFVKKVSGEKVFFSSVKSPRNGWNYVRIQPYNALVSDLNSLKIVLLLMITFTVVLTAVILVYLNKSIYRPISNLIGKINENEDLQEFLYGRYNEFEYLESAIELLITHKNTKRSTDRQGNIKSILADICADTVIPVETIEEIHMDSNGWFVVSIIKLEDYESINDKKMAKEMLLAKLQEFYCENIKIVSGYVSENTLLSLTCFTSEDIPRFSQIIEEIKCEMEESCNVIISAGVGNAYRGTEQLYNSYQEALNALRLVAFTNKGNVIDAQVDLMMVQGALDYHQILRVETSYIGCIKAFDYQGAMSCVEDFIRLLPHTPKIAENLPGLIWRFMDHMVVVMDEMNIKVIDAIQQTYGECYEVFINEDDLAGMKQFLFEKIKDFTAYLKKYHENRGENEALVVAICEYIQRNINKELTLDQIADKVNLSPKYISALFKQRFNMTLFAYINEIKMQKAQELLLNTKKNIDEISRELGYLNFRSFIRAFKNYYSLTPSQYRTNYAVKNIGESKNLDAD